MAEKIRLVAGDTRPQLIFSITDQETGIPFNFSQPTTAVRVKLREAGATAVKATMTCGKLTGVVNADGTINYNAPYDVPGAGGRVFMDWDPTALNTAGEYEAEIEITYSDGTVQTVYEILKFKVREQF